MNSVYEAIVSYNFSPSFYPLIDLKKPFHRVITEAPYEGYSVVIGKEKTISILPFYHPSRRNIFESWNTDVLHFTNIENNCIPPGSFVNILRKKYRN